MINLPWRAYQVGNPTLSVFLVGIIHLSGQIALAASSVLPVNNDSSLVIQQFVDDSHVLKSDANQLYHIIKETKLLEEYMAMNIAASNNTYGSFMQRLNKQIATRFAPIHHQEISQKGEHGLNGKADYITKINFDGDWVMTNNWENINALHKDATVFTATVYYSVIWTRSHWYISYAFFHPRDWSNLFCKDEHENDLEGILLVVPQTDINKAEVAAMVTVFHKHFYSFNRSGQNKNVLFSGNAETIDGAITFEGQHPRTAQEASGHGILNLQDNLESINPGKIGSVKFNKDGRVIYRPVKTTAEVPEWPTHINDEDVKYELVSIFEEGGLWDQRDNSDAFVGKSFKGDKGGNKCMVENAANAPWGWADKNDGMIAGSITTDPVYLIDRYFSNSDMLDLSYLYNPYPLPLPLNLPVERDTVTEVLVNQDTIENTSLESLDLLVYPNPTTGLFKIDIPNTPFIQEISIISMLGKTVYQGVVRESGKLSVDLSAHENGIYFIAWFSKGKRITKKIVLQK